ncbi:hypothetical protein [Cochlodiniinecator piscidefendens]|uniref:hypothetical protein n=1 Tax=Cochlodiniinecator piscidefendens TaxID=2715756 RepID=UPI0014077F7B|nr:hypothetical protein [Cochlodiniinecator piscidefendens]
MKTIVKAVSICATIFVSACAEYPQRISETYIPSIIYNGATCEQLRFEQTQLANYVTEVTSRQSRRANLDATYVTAGLLVTGIAFAGLPFTRDEAAQLSVARGHYTALTRSAAMQGCPLPRLSAQTGQPLRRGDGFPPL